MYLLSIYGGSAKTQKITLKEVQTRGQPSHKYVQVSLHPPKPTNMLKKSLQALQAFPGDEPISRRLMPTLINNQASFLKTKNVEEGQFEPKAKVISIFSLSIQ